MNELRRSLLFIPGNNPGMLQNADVFDADSIIIDLEDSVSLDEKDAARILLKELVNAIIFKNIELIVRINPFDSEDYQKDIEVVKNLNIDTILLPKADIQSVKDLDNKLTEINSEIKILVLIETAFGVEKVFDILETSDRCIGLMLGGEDLCVDLTCERTKSGEEIFYARTRLLNAAHALKLKAIDTPFTNTNDEAGLIEDTNFAKKLGFTGKASINPRQITSINKCFTPTIQEINHSMRILNANKQALKEGKGVFAIDGKMVDLPIIKRAEKTIVVAQKLGLIKNSGEYHAN